MSRAPRFVIRVSGQDQVETASTHWEAWCRSLELFRPGLTVSCLDSEARHWAEAEAVAGERAGEEGTEPTL
jgi:hypothetical protein